MARTTSFERIGILEARRGPHQCSSERNGAAGEEMKEWAIASMLGDGAMGMASIVAVTVAASSLPYSDTWQGSRATYSAAATDS